jgi:hypothetical protein
MNNIQTLTLKEKNITDFASARNSLLNKSKAEWILFLDTDEKLSKELALEITNYKLQDTNYSGFYIKRKIIFLGKEIGKDKVLRLAKRNSGKWVRKVHETWQIKGKIGTLQGYIIHNTADNLYDYIGKMNTYSCMHAKENIREGKKSSLFKIVLYPKLKFLENFIAGRGIVFSLLQSFHSFLGWAKQWELQKG